uniref:Family with sequence similarity 107 member B n=1 Tax=Callorhinchus milii TaxID=7868 RepID=A0A4W3GP56_CALMI
LHSNSCEDIGGRVMAEPDYIEEEDSAELIRPRKLINPVKSSRNHQDLQRELLINQKRGIVPQSKPELQRVMEQRKRDQVVKQKKEEEGQKRSDLEQELMKRQQRLDQVSLVRCNVQVQVLSVTVTPDVKDPATLLEKQREFLRTVTGLHSPGYN